MELNPEIWGPHFWFFLQTVSLLYPLKPNDVIKKKYYNFVQNLPLFIPNPQLKKKFCDLLDTSPVTPYLDSQGSFTKWVHYINNQMNIHLDIEPVNYEKYLENYYQHYKIKEKKSDNKDTYKIIVIIAFIGLIIFLYHK